jgi:hypothetical protein
MPPRRRYAGHEVSGIDGSAWSLNQLPETSSVIDHRHAATPHGHTKHGLELLTKARLTLVATDDTQTDQPAAELAAA